MNEYSTAHNISEPPHRFESLMNRLGKDALLKTLQSMLLIRHFETRAEAAYQQGKIGGFFHAYIGQEAIQTSIVDILGPSHWYVTSYRCHALALLLGATPDELMSELFGRENGNAKGRGGSMHFFTERLLGGHGIVGGQIPIGTGAAFASKYLGKSDEISVCFMGDGAVAQGAFHESLNLASLWNLPCVYIIENNQWGMGTAVKRAIAFESSIAEEKALGYGMKGYTLDGMDYLSCYTNFEKIFKEVQETQRPILVEVKTQRFKGHSISDPGLYRSKEALKECMSRDSIQKLKKDLMDMGWLDEEQFSVLDQQIKSIILASLEFADNSSWPNPMELEKDVFAP